MDGDREIADNDDVEEEHGDVVGHRGSGVVVVVVDNDDGKEDDDDDDDVGHEGLIMLIMVMPKSMMMMTLVTKGLGLLAALSDGLRGEDIETGLVASRTKTKA